MYECRDGDGATGCAARQAREILTLDHNSTIIAMQALDAAGKLCTARHSRAIYGLHPCTSGICTHIHVLISLRRKNPLTGNHRDLHSCEVLFKCVFGRVLFPPPPATSLSKTMNKDHGYVRQSLYIKFNMWTVTPVTPVNSTCTINSVRCDLHAV